MYTVVSTVCQSIENNKFISELRIFLNDGYITSYVRIHTKAGNAHLLQSTKYAMCM